jgi:hypothetical protein
MQAITVQFSLVNWLMSGNALQETDAGIIRTY